MNLKLLNLGRYFALQDIHKAKDHSTILTKA